MLILWWCFEVTIKDIWASPGVSRWWNFGVSCFKAIGGDVFIGWNLSRTSERISLQRDSKSRLRPRQWSSEMDEVHLCWRSGFLPFRMGQNHNQCPHDQVSSSHCHIYCWWRQWCWWHIDRITGPIPYGCIEGGCNASDKPWRIDW